MVHASAAPALAVGVESGPCCTVVRVGGDIDFHTAPDLRKHVFNLLRSGAKDVVIDLREVDFLDSSGLGVLVAVRRRLAASGGTLRVVCANEPILRIFRLTAIDRVVPVHQSLEEALAATG